MAEDRPQVAREKSGDAEKSNGNRWAERAGEWSSPLAISIGGFLAFTALSGLAIWLLPFSGPNQVSVILHTVAGLGFLIPCGWYLVRHWLRYWRDPMSHNLILGYVAGVATILCAISGLVLTWQAGVGTRISYGWDTVHIVTTFALLAFGLPHLLVIVFRDRKARQKTAGAEMPEMAGAYGKGVLIFTLGCIAVVAIASYAYPRVRLSNRFPADYSFKYGPDRPFAPSMAKTANGQAMDARLLSGSRSCGTSGCHEEIVKEWEVSAHRYSAMDLGFQAIQTTM
ncbi:MAG: hypothetical protein HYR58_07110, partial [Acidobacteria bacterium]|nr:hypothetical protein [Acidobacteriota bacterium]